MSHSGRTAHPVVRIVRLRLASLAVLLVVAFGVVQLAPGDPAAALLRSSGSEPSAAAIALQRRALGLDGPAPERFVRWAGGVLRGDFGRSWRNGQPVGSEIVRALRTTAAIAASAWVVIMAISIGISIAATLRRGGRFDRWTLAAVPLVSAVPGFVVGLVLMRLLAVEWRLLPVAGWGSPRQAVMPVAALALGAVAAQSRLLRAGLVASAGAGFLDGVRARGIPERTVVVRHLARHAAPPSIAASCLLLANLLVGSTLIEPLFAIPGLGRLAVDAIGQQDRPVVQAYVLIVGALYLALLTVSDALVAAADPLRDPTR